MRWFMYQLFRRPLDRLFERIFKGYIATRIDHIEMTLDVQHGTRYVIYADSLQASVNRLKAHVDDVKNEVAQRLIQYEDRSACDRKVILKQNERIAHLEAMDNLYTRPGRVIAVDGPVVEPAPIKEINEAP